MIAAQRQIIHVAFSLFSFFFLVTSHTHTPAHEMHKLWRQHLEGERGDLGITFGPSPLCDTGGLP